MLFPKKYDPVVLGDDEQIVLAVDGRILPSLSDFTFIFLFAPAWFLAPLLIVHRLFRPITYIITTERVLAVEPNGVLQAIMLSEIDHMKGSRTSLMVFGNNKRLWLARLPDAWFFESVLGNVIEKMAQNKTL